jgi:hypothetical protein
MGGTYRTRERDEKYLQNFGRKTWSRTFFRRPGCRWDDIKMGLREIRPVIMAGFIWFRIWTSGGFSGIQ